MLPHLPTPAELVASLDNELMDLLSERLKLAAELPVPRTSEEMYQQVVRMRKLCSVYRLPPELGETLAIALMKATRDRAAAEQKTGGVASVASVTPSLQVDR